MLVVTALYVVNIFFAYFFFLEKNERGLVFTNRSVHVILERQFLPRLLQRMCTPRHTNAHINAHTHIHAIRYSSGHVGAQIRLKMTTSPILHRAVRAHDVDQETCILTMTSHIYQKVYFKGKSVIHK